MLSHSGSSNGGGADIYNDSDPEEDDEDDDSNNSSTEYNEPFKKRCRNESLSLVNVSTSYKPPHFENVINQQKSTFQNLESTSITQLNSSLQCTKYGTNVDTKNANNIFLRSQIQFATTAAMIAAQTKTSPYIPSFLSSIFGPSRENSLISPSTSVIDSLDSLTSNMSANFGSLPLPRILPIDMLAMQNFFAQKSNNQKQQTECTEKNTNISSKNSKEITNTNSNLFSLITSTSIKNDAKNSDTTEKKNWNTNIIETKKVSPENIKKTKKLSSFDVNSILR